MFKRIQILSNRPFDFKDLRDEGRSLVLHIHPSEVKRSPLQKFNPFWAALVIFIQQYPSNSCWAVEKEHPCLLKVCADNAPYSMTWPTGLVWKKWPVPILIILPFNVTPYEK